MKLRILDHLTDPGSPGKPNDDSLCMGDDMAAVFDGATGLADQPVMPDIASDAAWIAELAAREFARAPQHPSDLIVRAIALAARREIARHADLSTLPRHAWPSSGFERVRLVGGLIEFSGLGDCSAYVLSRGGELRVHTALPAGREAEMATARSLLDSCGGYGERDGIVRQGEVLEALRRGRERQNTVEGGVWTLGLVEDAGDHVAVESMPAEPGVLVLLMTDGFSALSEMYRRHSMAGLVEIAARDGLSVLLAELRHVERALDPMAVEFPRFKRSDDATAILCEIA